MSCCWARKDIKAANTKTTVLKHRKEMIILDLTVHQPHGKLAGLRQPQVLMEKSAEVVKEVESLSFLLTYLTMVLP